MHLLPLFLALGLTTAHTTFTNFFINGTPENAGMCVRMSRHPSNATSPLPADAITSDDMACGVDGQAGVARVCPVPAGGVMTFEFRDWPDGSRAGSIDPSHKGPIAVYMKQVADPTANNTAAGDGWFKIYAADYDNSTEKWATETLIANNGHLSINLPSDLVGGYYLVRTEVLALHEADATPPDPQFYIGCAQIFLQSNGTAQPASTVAIPGYINMQSNAAALTFNIYKTPMALPYQMFGPPVYTPGATAQTVRAESTQQTLGLKPEGCVLENANWCGLELATYSEETGCWNSSSACWNQTALCYAQAPVTGSANCKIWEQKCKGIQNGCSAKDFNGPPSAGKDLTPPLSSMNLPAPANGAASNTFAVVTSVSTAATSTAVVSKAAASTAAVSSEAAESQAAAASTTESPPAAYTETVTDFITITAVAASGQVSHAAVSASSDDQTTTLTTTLYSTVTASLPSSSTIPLTSIYTTFLTTAKLTFTTTVDPATFLVSSPAAASVSAVNTTPYIFVNGTAVPLDVSVASGPSSPSIVAPGTSSPPTLTISTANTTTTPTASASSSTVASPMTVTAVPGQSEGDEGAGDPGDDGDQAEAGSDDETGDDSDDEGPQSAATNTTASTSADTTTAASTAMATISVATSTAADAATPSSSAAATSSVVFGVEYGTDA